ncbi:MAG: acetyl-CoA decarbonylase/synthase complex subunit gamma, partial [Nitrospirota bacterium]
GVEIFKLLPKTNCKKCGFPTCLAFAMKLAARQADINACPDVSEEAKRILGEASAPPVRQITLGVGEKAIKMGEETVLFRHDKKFVNPCAFALRINDNSSDNDIFNQIEAVKSSEVERVGQKLRVDMIAVENASGDAGRFEIVVKKIIESAPDVPLMLASSNLDAISAGLKHCADKKPLIYAAYEDNAEAMAAIAKERKLPLVVSSDNLDTLVTLSEKVRGLGIEDIILDSCAKSPKEIIEKNTIIRRAAIKKNFKPLGYPIITFTGIEDRETKDDSIHEAAIATVAVTKYASIVVLNSIEKWKMLALFTLRQNIYTDPQVPMQVAQEIYKVGEPTTESPLLVTTNFSLTYFIVRGEVENSKVPCWLAVMDAEGLSVLTAWAAGKFTASKIAEFIKGSEIENSINHRELIIPGYVAILSGALEEKLEGWKITVGPREANGIPSFFKSRTVGG